ncbi:MAG: hypothetical protein DRI90_14420 [Deltaproteobacteria bacterium]|nr:MAG: hypothetical protein DRI90_14420 [Deltaproteobacteria bacterium]
MHLPETLLSLTDEGIIDEVLRPLKSGKEAQIYLVTAGGQVRVAKIYKDALQRSFKQRAQYTEGRRTRNSRDQRAIRGRTRHGRAQEEDAWKSAEVDVLYRLDAQGVRVPTPYNFIDGVLIMDLVRGADGQPAPRLAELALDREVAHAYFEQLLREVVKMLCAGIVHGDLSDYNVLVDAEGPVIIDFPQSVDAASNRIARNLLMRDVDNLSAFLARCVPGARRRPYGQEIWAAYENNRLTPELELKGQFRRSTKAVDMGALLEVVEDANEDERRRRQASDASGPPPRRREVLVASPTNNKSRNGGRPRKRGQGGTAKDRNGPGRGAPADQGSNGAARQLTERRGAADQGAVMRAAEGDAAPKRRRRRRRGGAAQGTPGSSPQRNEAGSAQGRGSAATRGPSAGPPAADQAAAPNTPTPRKRRRRRKRKGGSTQTERTRNRAD